MGASQMQGSPSDPEIKEQAHQVCLVIWPLLCWGDGKLENLFLAIPGCWCKAAWSWPQDSARQDMFVLGWGAASFWWWSTRVSVGDPYCCSWGPSLAVLGTRKGAQMHYPASVITGMEICSVVHIFLRPLKIFLINMNTTRSNTEVRRPQSFWLAAEFAPFREAGDTGCVKRWSGSKVVCCFLYWLKKNLIFEE